MNTQGSCYINSGILNGTRLDFASCPENYNNLTETIILQCCVEIILRKSDSTIYGKFINWLAYYSSSFLLLPAIIFNLLALVGLSFCSKNKISSSFVTSTDYYMKYLCIFDMLTIISKFINEYIVVRNSLRPDPFVLNSLVCKLTHFMESVFGISSIYILISMSVNKLICVVFPFKSSSLLTPKTAKLTCLVIFLSAMVYSIYDIINQKVNIISNKSLSFNYDIYECVESNPQIAAKMQVANHIIRVFLPIILLCVCNILIAVSVSKAHKNTIKILSEISNDVNTSIYSFRKKENGSFLNKKTSITFNKELKSGRCCNLNISGSEIDLSVFDKASEKSVKSEKSKFKCFKIFERCFNKIKIPKEKPRINSISISSRKQKNSVSLKDSNYISIMLFSVSIGFIIFNLPFAIRTLYEKYFKVSDNKYDILNGHINVNNTFTKSYILNIIKYDLFVYITYFLLDLNYISNFFFYFLTSSKFRSRLYSLICARRSTNRQYRNKSTQLHSHSYKLRKMGSISEKK